MFSRVLVLGDDDIFLATCRSLGRAGIEIHAAEHDPSAPALVSKYIHRRHALPVYRQNPADWVGALGQLISLHRIDLVIPTSDCHLILLQTHADEIGRRHLAIPNEEALRVFTDKAATRLLANSLGIPVCEGLDLLPRLSAEQCAALRLPLVLKPRRSHVPGGEQRKLYASIVRSEAELRNQLLAQPPGDFIAEQFYPGTGIGLSVLSKDGAVVQSYQHRRLRQAWDTGPSSARVSEAVDPELEAAARKLAEATKLTGVAMFEFRRQGPGRFVLLEVNARLWGSLPVALEAGADFPLHLYKLLVHSIECPQAGYRLGVRKLDMLGEYRRVTDLLIGIRGGAGRLAGVFAAGHFLLTLLRRRRFDTWAADDPIPYYQARRRLLADIFAGLASRIRAALGATAIAAPTCAETSVMKVRESAADAPALGKAA